MKIELKTLLSVIGVAVVFVVLGGHVFAAAQGNERFQQQLQLTPAPELPLQAGILVSQLPATERLKFAPEIVAAAMQRAPAMAPEIVGAVARQAPDTAAVVAAEAAARQPKAAGAIAKAACTAAPDRASEIVLAMCKKLPAAYQEICTAASKAVPGAQKQFLAKLLEAVPNLKPFVERGAILASAQDGSVPVVLKYTAALVDKAASSFNKSSGEILAKGITAEQDAVLEKQYLSLAEAQPPPSGVIFVPGAGKPGELNRKHVQVVEKGEGRIKDYSLP